MPGPNTVAPVYYNPSVDRETQIPHQNVEKQHNDENLKHY